jgi:biofilm PGA synthesis N-glycosyltransferase PgaC
MGQRLLVITPVRNEADHLEQVAVAMAAQTRPPELWLLVDDQSTDGTDRIVTRIADELPFAMALSSPGHRALRDPRDRLASAAAPRTFNFGLSRVDWREFTHIGKLDGDMELPPDYFERLLGRFEADEHLGIGGGTYGELDRGRWRLARNPNEYHVPGALKLYSRRCFEEIGGIRERLAWDAIDETLARMHGFRTHTFDDLVAVHHRPWGSADGTLRGRARYGASDYIAHVPLYWVGLRSLKFMTARPIVISGFAFFYGYARAALRRTPQAEDREFRLAVRRELRGRVLHRLSLTSRVAVR